MEAPRAAAPPLPSVLPHQTQPVYSVRVRQEAATRCEPRVRDTNEPPDHTPGRRCQNGAVARLWPNDNAIAVSRERQGLPEEGQRRLRSGTDIDNRDTRIAWRRLVA